MEVKVLVSVTILLAIVGFSSQASKGTCPKDCTVIPIIGGPNNGGTLFTYPPYGKERPGTCPAYRNRTTCDDACITNGSPVPRECVPCCERCCPKKKHHKGHPLIIKIYLCLKNSLLDSLYE